MKVVTGMNQYPQYSHGRHDMSGDLFDVDDPISSPRTAPVVPPWLDQLRPRPDAAAEDEVEEGKKTNPSGLGDKIGAVAAREAAGVAPIEDEDFSGETYGVRPIASSELWVPPNHSARSANLPADSEPGAAGAAAVAARNGVVRRKPPSDKRVPGTRGSSSGGVLDFTPEE